MTEAMVSNVNVVFMLIFVSDCLSVLLNVFFYEQMMIRSKSVLPFSTPINSVLSAVILRLT